MYSKIVGLVLLAVCLIQVQADVFGGKQNFPGGGSHQQFGYQKGPAWGSMSQSTDKRGRTGPISYGAGADFNSDRGHGVSGSVHHTPGVGGQASVRGQVGLYNSKNGQVTGWVQHDRNLDKNFRPKRETNSAGINYQHRNGANAFVSASKNPRTPVRGNVGGSIPLHQSKNGNVRLTASGQSTVGRGMKPNHQVGLNLEGRF